MIIFNTQIRKILFWQTYIYLLLSKKSMPSISKNDADGKHILSWKAKMKFKYHMQYVNIAIKYLTL